MKEFVSSTLPSLLILRGWNFIQADFGSDIPGTHFCRLQRYYLSKTKVFKNLCS
uniref:Uncharacterized protein n=1 Tax=Rhizophora mucronata TaxID=61149 RepID=A0A2P2QR31_RHIMU